MRLPWEPNLYTKICHNGLTYYIVLDIDYIVAVESYETFSIYSTSKHRKDFHIIVNGTMLGKECIFRWKILLHIAKCQKRSWHLKTFYNESFTDLCRTLWVMGSQFAGSGLGYGKKLWKFKDLAILKGPDFPTFVTIFQQKLKNVLIWQYCKKIFPGPVREVVVFRSVITLYGNSVAQVQWEKNLVYDVTIQSCVKFGCHGNCTLSPEFDSSMSSNKSCDHC